MEKILTQSIQFGLRTFYPVFRKWLPFQVYSYLACGALNTALNIALFAFCYQVVLPTSGMNAGPVHFESYTISLLIAFIITIPTGFWLSREFAFASERTAKKGSSQIAKYILVVGQGLLSDYLIMKALIIYFSVPATIAKIISTIVVLTLNFLLQKYFTFREKK